MMKCTKCYKRESSKGRVSEVSKYRNADPYWRYAKDADDRARGPFRYFPAYYQCDYCLNKRALARALETSERAVKKVRDLEDLIWKQREVEKYSKIFVEKDME